MCLFLIDEGIVVLILSVLSSLQNGQLKGWESGREKGLEHLPTAVTEATTKYKEDCDTVGQWLEQKTTKIPTASIKSSEAYKSYKEWTEENGYYPVGVKTFKSSLEERKFTPQKKNNGNYFLGLAFNYNVV